MMFKASFFPNVFAKSVGVKEITLDDLADIMMKTVSPSKSEQPQVKFGTYGGNPLPNGCLRHGKNFVSITGVEADHDAGTMPIDEAAARLDDHGLVFLLCTTARHTSAHPRWHLFAPCSKELSPSERAQQISRLNGLLGDVLEPESWVPDTAYFYGNIAGQPDIQIIVSNNEETVDEADDLDSIARGPSQTGNAGGQAGGKGGKPDFDLLDENELRELIETGQHYYHPSIRLAEMGASQGLSESDVRQNLEAAFDVVPAPVRNAPGSKWAKGRANIPRWVKKGFARAAKRGGKFFQGLVDYFENGLLMKGAIRFNRFARRVEVADPFPPNQGQTIGTAYRAYADPADTLEAMINAQANGFGKATKGSVFDAIFLAACRRPCHPPRDYLDSLEWDGQERIHRLFIDYIPGSVPDWENDAGWHDRVVIYLKSTSRCTMIGAVARIFEPGCKLDTIPVLEGEQGFLKSRGLQSIVPDPTWFCDDIPANVSDKDSKLALDGKWIIELAELPHLRREVDRTKAFLSRQTDRYRPPYARLVADWPRQCCFIGTTNELELPDVTGNRRIWALKLAGPVRDEDIARDRDQLWAEAVHRYRQGEHWWLSPEVEKIAAEVADQYIESDVRDEVIETWIDTVTPDGETPRFTVREVLEHALGFRIDAKTDPGDDPRPIVSVADEKRTIRRLRRLGYRPEPRQTERGGKRYRFWVPLKS